MAEIKPWDAEDRLISLKEAASTASVSLATFKRWRHVDATNFPSVYPIDRRKRAMLLSEWQAYLRGRIERLKAHELAKNSNQITPIS